MKNRKSVSKPRAAKVVPAPEPLPVLDEDALDVLAADIQRLWRASDDARVQAGARVLNAMYGSQEAVARTEAADAHPAFEALSRRLAVPGMGIDKGELSIARRIAAWNAGLQDRFWRVLDYSRKAILLPLDDGAALLEGARHALENNVTLSNLRTWVEQRRIADGQGPTKRGRPLAGVARSISGLAELDARSFRRIEKEAAALTPERKAEALASIKEARATLARLEKVLR